MRARQLTLMIAVTMLLAGAPALLAQGGHFEFSGHYGRWTLNPLGNTAEELLNDLTKDEIQDRILADIQDSYPDLSLVSYDQAIDFSSRGDDFGFGFRWYPGGHHGSFSLGVSVEKSTFRVLPTADVVMELQDQDGEPVTFEGTADASAVIKAMSFLLTLRWDILPRAVVHPYITFGGGISTAKALDDSALSYNYSGQFSGIWVPAPPSFSGSDTKTLRQLKDEAETDFPLPNFVPFVQLNLGLKARLTKMVQILVDVGVFDGFMASAGLAIRL